MYQHIRLVARFSDVLIEFTKLPGEYACNYLIPSMGDQQATATEQDLAVPVDFSLRPRKDRNSPE